MAQPPIRSNLKYLVFIDQLIRDSNRKRISRTVEIPIADLPRIKKDDRITHNRHASHSYSK